jgi:hypothetical protein
MAEHAKRKAETSAGDNPKQDEEQRFEPPSARQPRKTQFGMGCLQNSDSHCA